MSENNGEGSNSMREARDGTVNYMGKNTVLMPEGATAKPVDRTVHTNYDTDDVRCVGTSVSMDTFVESCDASGEMYL